MYLLLYPVTYCGCVDGSSMISVYVRQHNSSVYYYVREEIAQESGVSRTTRWEYMMPTAVPLFLLEGILKVDMQVMSEEGGYAVGR
jgi:hypothetical protein